MLIADMQEKVHRQRQDLIRHGFAVPPAPSQGKAFILLSRTPGNDECKNSLGCLFLFVQIAYLLLVGYSAVLPDELWAVFLHNLFLYDSM